MRLVDEDAVIKRIVEVQGENIAPGAVPLYSIWKTILAQVPTIEAVPVRYGRWEPFHQSGELGYKCSFCNRHAYGVDITMFGGDYNYCPNCGALMEMDGGEE